VIIDRLGKLSWRETAFGEWAGSFECTTIRIGDYEWTSDPGVCTMSSLPVRAMIFAGCGIYFQLPHFTDPSKLITLLFEQALMQLMQIIGRFCNDDNLVNNI